MSGKSNLSKKTFKKLESSVSAKDVKDDDKEKNEPKKKQEDAHILKAKDIIKKLTENHEHYFVGKEVPLHMNASYV